jgi:AcrR family transcriptional regulator
MDVRDRILEAALGLLAGSGAHELTQPKVSRAAGVRQSHLTYYFPTVTDLLQAVALRSLDTLAKEVYEARERKRPGSLADALAHGSADKRRVRMMLGLANAADRDPSLKPRMRAFVKELRGRVAGFMEAGGVQANEDEVAFMHTVIVGAAVLQFARDNAEARKEARQVLKKAIQCLARRS